MSSNPHIVDVIEAAYRIDESEPAWLEGVAKAIAAHIDRGLGVWAYIFDAADIERVGVGSFWSDGKAVMRTREHIQAVVRQTDPEYVRHTWRGLPCSTVSQTPGIERQPGYAALGALGIHDIHVVNGIDPTWQGVWVGACLPEKTKLESGVQALWSRVAAHVASGFRVRRRLEMVENRAATNGAEAILEPGGKVVHAEAPAKSRPAREMLRDAARAIDHVRSTGRDSPEGIEEWRGLIAARWTLVDHFETDGRRYLCARRNDSGVEETRGLTDREYQVAAFLSLGHSTKLIAYELGISASTVRVLLGRAAAKLGAKSREDVVRALNEGAFTFASKP